MKKNKKLLSQQCIYLVIFSLILLINSYCIWAADDYAFYNNCWLGINHFSIVNLFKKTNIFYTAWTGRYFSTFINYFFIYFNKYIFNIFNSFAFTLLIFFLNNIIKKLTNYKDRFNNIIILTIFISVWFLTPSFAEVALWQIGSIIYLWMMLFALIVIDIMLSVVLKNKSIKNWEYLYLIILCIIAGNGFETIGLILLAFELLATIYSFYKKNNKKTISIIFGATLIGFCFNFFSPGNSVRIDSMTLGNSLIDKVFNGGIYILYRGIYQSRIYIICSIISVLLFIYYISRNKKIALTNIIILLINILLGCLFLNKDLTKALLFYYNNYKIIIPVITLLLIAICFVIINLLIDEFLKKKNDKIIFLTIIYISAIAGIMIYIFAPFAWARSYFGMSIYLIIVMISIITNLIDKYKIIYYPIIAILFIIFSYSYITALNDNIRIYKWNNEVISIINKAVSNDKKEIQVPFNSSTNRYNSASVEKYIIPPKKDNADEELTSNKIPIDYEWININITNYYYKSNSAWSNNKRIYTLE